MATSLIGNLAVLLSLDTSAFERGTNQATRLMARTQRQFGQMGQRIQNVGRAMTLGITLPVVAFGAHAARAASDAAELESAFAQTFGNMTAAMQRWAVQTGNTLGRSTREIMEGANAFGLYFNQAARTREEAARLSRQFTVLAQDLSSFHNTSVPDALAALRSGLSGETEPLRRYGVFLNEAAVQAQALAMGLQPVNGRLTDQQKIMARAAIIMNATRNAQGDVLRTASGTANQLRRAQAAWEELSIAVGTRLLPVLTPLIEKLGTLLDRFAQLPPGVQQFAIGAAALGAVLGPITVAIGGIVRGVAAILPLLTRLAPGMAAVAGAAGGWRVALAVIPRLLGPIGIAITAIVLAFQHWDTITAAFERAFGPTMRAAIAEITQALTELWQGPLGEAIRAVGPALLDLGRILMQVLGPPTVALLRGLIAAFAGAVRLIADFINTVVRLLQGDFAGAWTAAKALVSNFFTSLGNIVEAIVPGVLGAVRRLYEGVKHWLGERLADVGRMVAEHVRAIARPFQWLYDVVVGHSYVPDMVDEIGRHMRRLHDEMAVPAAAAASEVETTFASLRSEVPGLLDRLYPDQARENRFLTELQMLDEWARRGMLSVEALAAATARLRAEFDRPRQEEHEQAHGGEIASAMSEAADGWEQEQAPRILGMNARVIESFANLARSVAGSLKGVIDSIKSGDWLSALQGVLEIVGQVVSVIRGPNAGGAPPSLNFGGFRAAGGPVTAGKGYVVGERGPEWFRPDRSGFIAPANDRGPKVQIEPSPYFDVVVDGRVVRTGAPLVAAGMSSARAGAQSDLHRRAARTIP